MHNVRWLLAALALVFAAPAWALSGDPGRRPLCVDLGRVEACTPQLVTFHDQLPQRREGEGDRAWEARQERALEAFKRQVAGRYAEGRLQRLTDDIDVRARRAAVLALRLTGTMASNDALAARLHDEDAQVRQLAADALWDVWFRAEGEARQKELQRAMQHRDPELGVEALTAILRRSPRFAEAYNQRGVLYFQLQEYEKCAADCDKALQLNRHHFGAAAGLGRCYLRLRLPQPALKAFRTAHQINPDLEGVAEAIRELESLLKGGINGDRDR